MNKFKKQITMSLVIITALSTLSGCTQNSTYSSIAKGFGGDVEVSVTLDGDKITDIAVVGEKETEGIGTKAIEELPKMILESNSTDIDSIAGATITSDAIKEATNSAINQSTSNLATKDSKLNMQPGKYIGKSKGYSAELEVEVEVSADEILSINLLNNIPQENEMIDREFWASKYSIGMLSDTPQILKTVTDRLPERIVESQSLMVDNITGATASSNGFINAVKDAITQAGGDVSILNKPIEKSNKTESYEADVVVIGGGHLVHLLQLLQKIMELRLF